MKTNTTILMFILMNLNSFAQQTKENVCEICNVNQDHKYDVNNSFTLITNFNNEFKDILSYGGTIYGDQDYFNNGFQSPLPLGTSRTFKFYFCSTEATTKDNFFLVFENGYCKNNILKNFTGFTNFYFTSGNKSFPKIPCDPKGSSDCLQLDREHKEHPNFFRPLSSWKKMQNFDFNKLSAYKKYFETKEIFTKKLKVCNTEFVGYFIYDNSIDHIFKNLDSLNDKKCEGIRYYYAFDRTDTTYQIRVILVGVDEDGNNLHTWRETSIPNDKSKAE